MKIILRVFKQLTNTHERILLTIAFFTGFISTVFQLIFIREFMSFFLGAELVIGIIFASWLLITALGCTKYSKAATSIPLCLIGLSIFSILAILSVRILRMSFITILDLGIIVLVCILILCPFCFLSGFLIRTLVETTSRYGVRIISFLDTIGGILAGIVFNFLFSHYLSPFSTVFILSVISLLLTIFLTYKEKPLVTICSLLIMLIVFVLNYYNVEKITIELFLPSQKLVETLHTPNGVIHIFKDEEQYNVFKSNILIGSTNDLISRESIAHFGTSQHPNPQKVLLISGGIFGVFEELRKYPTIELIDYIEIDPIIVNIVLKFYTKNEKLKPHFIDPRKFLFLNENTYDVIIVNTPDPSSLELNRYYTLEFFSLIKKALKKNGVFSFRITGPENYVTKELSLLASSIFNSVKKYFNNLIVVPGKNTYIIASDRNLSYDFETLLTERNIKTNFIKNSYLSALLTTDRIESLLRSWSITTKPNSDFLPIASLVSFKYWLTHFDTGFVPMLGILIFVLALLLKLIFSTENKLLAFTLSTTGYSTISLQLIAMMSFQIIFGSLYKELSTFIATFFLGFAIGNYLFKHGKFKYFFISDLFLSLMSILYALIVINSPSFLGKPFLFSFNFFIGLMGGIQLVVTASLFHVQQGRVFSFDLIGACLGALITGLLTASFGIANICIGIGILKLFTGISVVLKSRARRGEYITTKVPNINYILFFILIWFLMEGSLILSKDTSMRIYSFSFSAFYQWGIIFFLTIGLIISMEIFPNFKINSFKNIFNISFLSLVYFMFFSLITFFPVFKCYFKIPYIFCHVCPRKCIFGFFRPYTIPAIIIMNLNKRSWCIKMCPIGTLVGRDGKRILNKWGFFIMSSLVALFIMYSYFKIESDAFSENLNKFDWYNYFLKNSYSSELTVLISALAIIFMGFFIKRFFCRTLCPLWLISEIEQKLEFLIFPNKKKGVET